jgi:hypothetical protein
MISVGQIGKSLVLGEGIASWLQYANIPHALIDCDHEHRTLSDRFQDAVFAPVHSSDDFRLLFEELGGLPVDIIDLPAQQTTFFMDCFHQFHTLELLASKAVRMTIFIFAAELPAAIQSAARIVETFHDAVDYVIVENPARFKSNGFYRSRVAKSLTTLGAKKLEIPFITATTWEEIKKLSAHEGRWLSLTESKEKLSISSRADVEYFLGQMTVRCEDIADILVPELALIKNKAIRLSLPQKTKINNRLAGAL